MSKQPKRAAVRPVQIIQVKEQTLSPGQFRKNMSDGVKEQQAFFVCGQLMTSRKRTQTCFNFRGELGDLRGAFSNYFAEFPVVFLFAHPAAERFNKRQVRRRRLIFITGATEYDCAVEC